MKPRHLKLMTLAAIAMVSAAVASPIQAAAAPILPVNQMVVFGDSLSDTGNLANLLANYPSYSSYIPAPPNYAPGEFTDGANTSPSTTKLGLWDQQFTTDMGLPSPVPAMSTGFLADYLFTGGYSLNPGGTNFAVAGAVTGGTVVNTSAGQFQAGMSTEVSAFESQFSPGTSISANSLYAFWGGANDILNAASTTGATAASVITAGTTAANNIAGYISDLTSRGGKYFLWFNLPPLAATPQGAGSPLSAAIASATNTYNTQQAADISTLETASPGIKIIQVDVNALFASLTADPGAYGFTNLTAPAQGKSVNPDQYLFWDGLHPTTAADSYLAAAAANDTLNAFGIPTPEPESLAIFMTAAVLIAAGRVRLSARPKL